MHTEELIQLGFSKNEAQIFETLVKFGKLPVSDISQKSNIHRRNVYDCMNRLIEKGFVFEIPTSHENYYKVVNPEKLNEIVQEKQKVLDKILPDLTLLYNKESHDEDVYILKGVEGWKNYMAKILETKQDVYTIGGGGLWTDPKLRNYFQNFLSEAEELGIKFHLLFDYEVKSEKREILEELAGTNYKFFSKEYSTNASIDIFGNYTVIMSKGEKSLIDDSLLTVISNRGTADAFRVWFKLMWKACD